MNWEAISAISEAIAAIGVIVTLIYLAMQIRHNTRTVDGSTQQMLMSQEIEIYRLFTDHADVLVKGNKDLTSLTESEKEVYVYLVFAHMSQLYSGYVQHDKELIPEEVWEAYTNSAVMSLEQPGFRQVWQDVKHTYPVGFIRMVDTIISEHIEGRTESWGQSKVPE